MIRQLIFDLDGTLVDSCGICVRILDSMLDDRGSDYRIDPVFARPFMSLGGTTMVAALLGSACGDPQVEIEEFRARYRTIVTPPQALFDGVAEGLTRFRDDGFVLSICSNKPQELCEQVLADTGIAPLFEAVVGLRMGVRAKPEPDLLVETLGRLRASAKECLFIGDSAVDHQVADEAGIPFVFMSYGYADADFRHHDGESFDCFHAMSRTVAARIASVRAA
jgi:phosphoglycolate phosphatase